MYLKTVYCWGLINCSVGNVRLVSRCILRKHWCRYQSVFRRCGLLWSGRRLVPSDDNVIDSFRHNAVFSRCVLNNVDPDSANSSASQIAKNAATSGLKALATSSLTSLVGSGVGGVNYKTGVIEGAVLDGCGGLIPSLTLGFGEGIKAFFGWADDAVIYLWE